MSQSGSVSLKRFRDKLGLYVRLPGQAKRFNLNLGLADNTENERIIERDVIPLLKADMVRRDWKALHERYPGCQQIAAMLPDGSGLTMDELFERMVRNWKDKKRRSLGDLLSKLVEVREFFKGKRVCDVSFEVIQAFVDALRERGLGPAAANRKLAQVRRAFNYAFKKKVIKALPAFPDPFDEPAPRQVRFTEVEVELLVAKLPERLKRVARVASITGWRVDELLSRKWRTDIDFEKGLLYLDAEESKNGEPRMFPLTPRLKSVLEEQIAFVEALEHTAGRVIPWLFPNDDLRHQVGERIRRFDKALQSGCRAAGLNVDANGKPVRRWFHDFRRMAQDHMEEMGINDLAIMEVVGHKTLSMRKRYRGNTNPKRVSGIGERLAEAEAAAPQSKLMSKVVSLADFPRNSAFSEGRGGESATASGAGENPVQHACNTGVGEGGRENVRLERPANSRGFRWAGSESNTRHKDFQS